MRQGPNPKRSRGRNNNNNNNNNNGGRRPNMPLRMQTFDSNGPDVRIRGSAFQVHEKYLQLARDASSSGDRIIAESYLQHAEHYYRIIAAAQEQQQQQNANDPNRRYRPEGYNGQEFRNGQPGEEGAGEGGDEFPSEEQGEGQAPRGDNYRQDGRQQEGRHQQDGRPQQDPAYRPQPETHFRGQGDRNQSDRNQQEGGYRQQSDKAATTAARQKASIAATAITNIAKSPDNGGRRRDGEPRQHAEERPRRAHLRRPPG